MSTDGDAGLLFLFVCFFKAHFLSSFITYCLCKNIDLFWIQKTGGNFSRRCSQRSKYAFLCDYF